MTWNYRIVQYASGEGYGLHEVHYNEDGEEISMTSEPASFVGDSLEEINGALMVAKSDAHRRPVFVEPPEWAECCTACGGSGKASIRKEAAHKPAHNSPIEPREASPETPPPAPPR